jgi:hypothetical protein
MEVEMGQVVDGTILKFSSFKKTCGLKLLR